MRHSPASHRLTQALIRLQQRPRCSDPETHDLWLSEHPEDRVIAASWCTGCPILTECRAAATDNDERFGVWGGHDYTSQPGQARPG